MLFRSGANLGAWALLGNANTNPATNFIGTTDAQPLAFRTVGIEKMRLGTDGTLNIRNGNSSGSLAADQITFGWLGGAYDYRHAIKTRHNSSGGIDNSIDFYVWKASDGPSAVGSQHIMSLQGTNNGSVGIGTTNPINKLDVSGGAVIGASYASVNTAPTNGLLVQGNAGIGINAPLSRLHLSGENKPFLTIQGTGLANTNTYTQGGIQFAESGSTAWGFKIDFNSPDLANTVPLNQNTLRFRSVNSSVEDDILVMNQSGNSGFGTVTPQNKLDIEGAMVIGASYSGTNVAPTNSLLVEGSVGVGTTFPNQQLEITQAFRMPATTSATTGVIYKGANRFMHDYKPPTNDGFNTFLGNQAGNFTMSGATSWMASYNTGIGNNALNANTSGAGGTAVGNGSLSANTTGNSNTAVGNAALTANTTGSGNTAIGNSALTTNNGDGNTGLGNSALRANTTGYGNTATGESALKANTTGFFNSAYGQAAMEFSTTGYNNTAIGEAAMNSNTTGFSNAALGLGAMKSNTTGSNNIAMGDASMFSNTTASDNVAIGSAALRTNIIGNTNIAIGNAALFNNTASSNVAIGKFAGTANTTGTDNIYIGNDTGLGATTGNGNTFLGDNTGPTMLSGSYNTFIGKNANSTAGTFNNAVAIGYNASVGASNAMVLGGSGADAVNVGIGTSTPAATLDMGSRTDAVIVPKGTTAQRPASPQTGMLRYNTSLGRMEYYNGTTWIAL